MTLATAITTFTGAFIFPFIIRMYWGKLVDEWGAIGGWVASIAIVGLAWALNHGIETPFFFQTGAWVDQGLAAGVGVWVASILVGGNAKKSIPNISAALLGGLIAGIILIL